MSTQYLRLIGRLHPDNRIELRPGYLTDNPAGSQEDPDSPVVAELFDQDSRLLLRHRVPARPYCTEGGLLPVLAVRAKIPFPPATRTLRLLRHGVVLHEIAVSEGAPSVKLTWPPSGLAEARGRHVVRWTGEHPRRAPLQYFLRYSHTDGKTWQRVGWRTEETSQEIDFEQLPGGARCRLAVVATDGVNTVTAPSGPFRVRVKPCQAVILSPEDGALLEPGAAVLLHGQGFYLEEHRADTEQLAWISSRDGDLGTGTMVRVPKLSPGLHRVTLRAGAGRRAGSASIVVRVGRGRGRPRRPRKT